MRVCPTLISRNSFRVTFSCLMLNFRNIYYTFSILARKTVTLQPILFLIAFVSLGFFFRFLSFVGKYSKNKSNIMYICVDFCLFLTYFNDIRVDLGVYESKK